MVKSVQQANTQFHFKLGKIAAEMYKMSITAYRSDAVTKKTLSHWLHPSTRKELFILKLFPDVKCLVQHFIKNSCNKWDRLSDRKEREMVKWFDAHYDMPCPTTSFWWVEVFPCYCNQPTLATSHYVPCDCSPHSKKHLHENDLTQLLISLSTEHAICKRFQKKASRKWQEC